jgi:hypothetical protein
MRQGTPEECAACAPDVHRFCEAALQDAMRVLACLQANRPKISAGCNRVLVSPGLAFANMLSIEATSCPSPKAPYGDETDHVY